MNEKKILILTAMKIEAQPLIKSLHLRRDPTSPDMHYRNNTGNITLSVVGIARHATQSFEHELSAQHPDFIIIAGVSGGLSPSLSTGDVIIPATIISPDHTPISPTITSTPTQNTLLTSDKVLNSPQEKSAACDQYQAHAVDMETYHLAELCNAKQIPWLAIRSICDNSQTTLPPWVLDLTKPDGRVHIPGIIRQLCNNPIRIKHLLAMQKVTKCATLSLSAKVASVVADIQQ